MLMVDWQRRYIPLQSSAIMSETAQPVLWSVLIMALLSVAKSQSKMNCMFYVQLFIITPMHAVVPSSYIIFNDVTVSVSGSSATGHCSNVSNTEVKSTCTDPSSSVLFDGVIPTLTGLDGDMWASQLLTLQKNTLGPTVIFNFTGTQDYVGLSGRLEVVMFNCPERGISASAIRVPISSSPSVNPTPPLMVVNINITSCDSLVRVCTPIMTVQPSISLQFPHSDMVYLAEVTFYAASSASTCPPDTIIPNSTFPDLEESTTPTGTSATIQHITSTLVAQVCSHASVVQ